MWEHQNCLVFQSKCSRNFSMSLNGCVSDRIWLQESPEVYLSSANSLNIAFKQFIYLMSTYFFKILPGFKLFIESADFTFWKFYLIIRSTTWYSHQMHCFCGNLLQFLWDIFWMHFNFVTFWSCSGVTQFRVIWFRPRSWTTRSRLFQD